MGNCYTSFLILSVCWGHFLFRLLFPFLAIHSHTSRTKTEFVLEANLKKPNQKNAQFFVDYGN